MNELAKLAHLVAGIVWMGGMTFMLLALRPAAVAALEPQPRARLMLQVWRRFFAVVLVAIVVLLATGTHMYTALFKANKAAGGVGGVPLGWTMMMGIGLLMMLIFGHIYAAGFGKFKRALAAEAWPAVAAASSQIQTMMLTNFILGWLAIAAVRLVH